MAAVYHKETYKRMHWYNEMVKWPKSCFDSSAIVDALKLTSMQSKETPHNLTTHILPGDCLAKWSARILTRSACIVEMDEQDSNSATVSHALLWCTSANEIAISRQVLHCIDTIDIEDVATLPWLRQEIIARRQLALERNDTDVISSLLERTETIPPSLIQKAPVEDVVGINHLALLLRCDLKELNKERLKYTLNDTLERTSGSERKALGDNRRVLCDMVRLAVTHYDAMWKDASDPEQNDLVIEISEAIGLALNQDLHVEYGVLVDVLLRRLDEFSGQLNAEATAAVLSKMENLIHVLDDVALNELMRNRHKLADSPSEILSKLVREGEETDKLKMCLQLVADPKYSLHQYCKELMRALLNNDGDLWSRIFKRMMQKIFENPYAGVDYLVLAKHQATLDNIREFGKYTAR
ncbi:uncharacterized protein [Battus philenor]|uniref:uncharacterized protein n=1 Tax=Battus philenor TaxID=42288 RepID=UPI0035D027AC